MARIDTRPVRDFVAATTAVLREAPTEARALDRLGLRPGQVDAVPPAIGDIGTVPRHLYAADGAIEPFVSGRSNDGLPKLWSAA